MEIKVIQIKGSYDSVGGYHSNGEGWNPLHNYCGRCDKTSCENCSERYTPDREKTDYGE